MLASEHLSEQLVVPVFAPKIVIFSFKTVVDFGQLLALMSMVDNNASKELILSVHDDIRPNLLGRHYNDRDSFYSLYKDEACNWIEKASKDN